MKSGLRSFDKPATFYASNPSESALAALKSQAGGLTAAEIRMRLVQYGQRQQRFLRVRRFWEKHSRYVAKRLMNGGSLWNTFVMVGHLEAFLEIIFRTLPGLYRMLFPAREALGSVTEEQVLKRLYSEIISANFSKRYSRNRNLITFVRHL